MHAHHMDILNSVPSSRPNSPCLSYPYLGWEIEHTLRSMLALLTEETHIQTRDRERERKSGRKVPMQIRTVSMEGRTEGGIVAAIDQTPCWICYYLRQLGRGSQYCSPPVGWFNRFTQITRTPHHLLLVSGTTTRQSPLSVQWVHGAF